MRRLAIGYGRPYRAGWTTLDAHAGEIIATIPPLPPEVTAVKWGCIEWIHGIASLYPRDATKVLPQLREVLAPDGFLILETPNIQIAGASGVVRWMYGDPTYSDPLMMNHWGYTPETLAEALRVAGFTRIKVKPARHHFPGRDFRIEAQP